MLMSSVPTINRSSETRRRRRRRRHLLPLMMLLILTSICLTNCSCGSRPNTAGRTSGSSRPERHDHGENLLKENLHVYVDYSKDGYHKPPTSTNPHPGPINNVKKPSPSLKP